MQALFQPRTASRAPRGRAQQVWRGALLHGLLWSLFLMGCEQGAPAPVVDHMALARQLEADATKDGKTLSPTDSTYDKILRELQLVPTSAPEYADAQARLKEMRRAQQQALWSTHQEEGGSYQPEVALDEEGNPLQKGAGAGERDLSKGSYVAGVWTPYQNVNVGALAGGAGGKSSGAARAAASSAESSASASTGAVSVTIYTASWCGVCKAAKKYMSSKGISYTERDVEADPSAKQEASAKSGGATSVPVIDVNGKIMVGFDQSAFDRMVKKARG